MNVADESQLQQHRGPAELAHHVEVGFLLATIGPCLQWRNEYSQTGSACVHRLPAPSVVHKRLKTIGPAIRRCVDVYGNKAGSLQAIGHVGALSQRHGFILGAAQARVTIVMAVQVVAHLAGKVKG